MAEIAARPPREPAAAARSRAGDLALVAALLVMAAGAALFARAYTVRDAVLPGVSVAGVDVGGLSRRGRAGEAPGRARAAARRAGARLGGRQVLVDPARHGLRRSTSPRPSERAYQAGRESVLSRLGALVAPFAFTQDVEPVLELLPGERSRHREQLRELTHAARRTPQLRHGRQGGRRPPGRRRHRGRRRPAARLASRRRRLPPDGPLTAAVHEVAPPITTEEAEAVARAGARRSLRRRWGSS